MRPQLLNPEHKHAIVDFGDAVIHILFLGAGQVPQELMLLQQFAGVVGNQRLMILGDHGQEMVVGFEFYMQCVDFFVLYSHLHCFPGLWNHFLSDKISFFPHHRKPITFGI